MADNKKVKLFWALAAILGFASFISFFQVSSAFADEHKLNTVFTIGGIIFGLTAIYSMWQAFQNSGGSGDQER